MSAEEENEIINENRDVYGRTWADLIYTARYRLLGIIIIAFIIATGTIFGYLHLLRHLFGYIIMVPVIIGIVIGIVYGYYTFKPSTSYVIEIVDNRSLRVREVVTGYAIPLSEGEPYITRNGKLLWISKPGTVSISGDYILFEPHELHKLSLIDPLSAYVHIKAIDKLVNELERLTEQLTRTYAKTRLQARYLARKRVNELIHLEDNVVNAIKQTIDSELGGDNK